MGLGQIRHHQPVVSPVPEPTRRRRHRRSGVERLPVDTVGAVPKTHHQLCERLHLDHSSPRCSSTGLPAPTKPTRQYGGFSQPRLDWRRGTANPSRESLGLPPTAAGSPTRTAAAHRFPGRPERRRPAVRPLDRSGAGEHVTRRVRPVAHRQPAPGVVALVGEPAGVNGST